MDEKLYNISKDSNDITFFFISEYYCPSAKLLIKTDIALSREYFLNGNW